MNASELPQPEPNPYSPPASEGETPHAWGSEPVIESLRQTRPWVLMFSILGFIGAAIITCVGVFEAALSFGQPTMEKAGEAFGAGLVTVVIGVLYYFPSLYLLRFAGHVRDLAFTHRVADLEAALRAQKSFWRFCGIVVALVLTLYAVIIVGAIGMAVFVKFPAPL